jgi:tetratricopeptide (TPR) repeat protein
LILALPGTAQAMTSAAECQAAIAADAEAAREAAAQWVLSGGGAEARLCEAAALTALGAIGTAAEKLTMLAQDRGVNLSAGLRAQILEDAGGLWLDAGQPKIAAEVLDAALQLAAPDVGRLLATVQAHRSAGNMRDARAILELLVAQYPDEPDALALAAEFALLQDQATRALELAGAALRRDPAHAEAMFRRAEAYARLGQRERAAEAWLALVAAHPGTDIADRARAAVQGLAE